MGDTEASKMRFFLIWLRVKKNNLINSKAFIFLLGLIIGATLLYTYVEGLKWYSWLQTGLVYANSTQRDSLVTTSENSGEQVFDKSDGVVVSDATPYDTLLKKYFGDESKLAYAIMMCESSGDSQRIGDKQMEKWSYGLFQINQTWHGLSEEQLLDAETNVKYAKELRDKSGWNQWSCFKNGGFNKFL